MQTVNARVGKEAFHINFGPDIVTVGQLRALIAAELKEKAAHVQLMFAGRELADLEVLAKTNVLSDGRVDIFFDRTRASAPPLFLAFPHPAPLVAPVVEPRVHVRLDN